MKKHEKIQQWAAALRTAEATRIAISPLTEEDTLLNIDDAYQIQLANVEYALGEGHEISGKKIGLTSEGIQKQLGVSEPDYGHLFATMNCVDGKVKTEELLQPKIEGEIAFVLKAGLTGGSVTAKDVLIATDYVVAAFEIVDSRVADWKIKLVDTVADNASSGRYILGTTRLKLEEVALPKVSMRLFKNNELIQQGTGAAVLGDPCNAVAWLANRLWEYGVPLNAGEVILSGAFSAAPAAAKGDIFRAEFSGFGVVQAEFI